MMGIGLQHKSQYVVGTCKGGNEMATREELLYHERFGPHLLEAIILIMLDALNVLRSTMSLPDKTLSQITETLENKLSSVLKYNWMDK